MTKGNGQIPIAEITFQKPILEGSDSFSGIKILREPTLGDMDGLPMDQNLDSIGLSLLLGRISDLQSPIIKRMTLKDVAEVMGVLKPFLPGSEDGG